MRTKVLLVFALLISSGVLTQAQFNCGAYPLSRSGSGALASEWVIPWFAAEGDPAAANIETSPGWKSWISITNLSKKEVSVELMFQKTSGEGYGQPVWLTVRDSSPTGVTGTQFGMNPGETVEVRVSAKAADMFAATTGLATGWVDVIFTSRSPCDLDVQGKVSLLFAEVKPDGKITRMGSVAASRLSSATTSAMLGVSVTPAWARTGNAMSEVTSFALVNLGGQEQTIKATLIGGADGNTTLGVKFVTLKAGAVTGMSVEDLFGVEAFNTANKVFSGRVEFVGTDLLAAIALQFVGDDAMGSRGVWNF